MDIKYTQRYGPSKERRMSLQSIIENVAYDSDFERGALERVRAVADTAIKFNAMVVEILHRKGIMNDKEIMEIVSRMDSVDESKDFKIIHDE
jgi:hypothetical protein